MTRNIRYRTTHMRSGQEPETYNVRDRLLKEALNHPDVLGIGFYVVFVVFYFLVMDQP